jgi:hypothetical protein
MRVVSGRQGGGPEIAPSTSAPIRRAVSGLTAF